MTPLTRVPAAVVCSAVLAMLVGCGDESTGLAPATQLAFTIQPANDTVGSSISAVTVTALTAQGSPATGFTGTVTVALGANPGGAALSGTMAVAAITGAAQFSNLSINKAEDGYTLTATSGTLTVTSTPFDISEVVRRIALRYEREYHDLETGVTSDCFVPCPGGPPAAVDFYIAYNSVPAIHSVVAQQSGRQIAHLIGRTFATVHLADTTGVAFSSSLNSAPFDNGRTILLRTDAGNVYKLGNPTEFGANGADSVRFHVARLN